MSSAAHAPKVALLAALNAVEALNVECRACRHHARIESGAPFWRQWRPDASLSVVEDQARCARCGARGCVIWLASPKRPADGPAAPIAPW